jgi:uncharacterized protein (TIGR03792 family)
MSAMGRMRFAPRLLARNAHGTSRLRIHVDPGSMTVEILHFHVQPGLRDEFIQRNEELWTPALRDQPGFLGREILTCDDRPDEVVIVIRWRARADLEAFPREKQGRLEARMADLVRHQAQHAYERILPGPAPG